MLVSAMLITRKGKPEIMSTIAKITRKIAKMHARYAQAGMRRTAYRSEVPPEHRKAWLEWALNPEGPYTELWHYDSDLKWKDDTPIDRTPSPAKGLSLFYADVDRRRIEVREIEKMGRKAVDSNQLFIDGLEVPIEDRIGELTIDVGIGHRSGFATVDGNS